MSKTKPRPKEDYKNESKEMEIILDNIPGLVFFKDNNNTFIRVNKRIAEAYNLSKEELKGKSLFELHSKEQAQAYWDNDLEVIRNAKPKLNIEEPWETEEGLRWLNTNKIPYIDDNGKIKGIIGFSVDITERKLAEEKLEESKEKLKILNDELEIKVEERTHELGERVKELTCLCDISNLIDESNIIDENLLQKIVNRIPSSMQYPNITCTRITIEGQEYKTNNFKTSSWKLSADINVDLNKIGIIEIFYVKEKPMSSYNPFLQEEKNFINVIAEILGRSIKRKQMEQKLKESEENYHLIFDKSPDYIYLSDIKGNLIDANQALLERVGLNLEELRKKNFLDFYAENNAEDLTNMFSRIISGEEIKNLEVKAKNIHGEVFLYEVDAVPLKKNGEITQILNIARDITERRVAEEKIIDLARFPAEDPNPILRVSNEYVIYLNRSAQNLFDIKAGDKIPFILRNNIAKAFSTNSELEFEIKINRKFYSLFITPVKGTNYANIYGMDITNRKKAENKIKEQYEFLSNVIKSLTHPFCVINVKDYSIELANFDINDTNDPKNMTCFEQIHKQDKPCKGDHPCPLDIVKETKKPVIVEHIHYDEDVQPRYYEVFGYPIFDEKGNVSKMIEYNLDITERKNAEAALRESEESFRTLAKNANDGILIVNQNEEFVYANRRMSEITGYSVDVLLEQKIKDLSHPDEFKKIKDNFKRSLEGKLVPRQYETIIINRNGENVPVEITAAKTLWKGINAYIIVFRDITERKKGEVALLEMLEKLMRSNEDLEQFAYIVSHDLQEPLRMVSSFTQLLQKRYHNKLDTDANDFINFAIDGTKRMQKLINELLAFSRVGTRGKPFKETDMNYVLKSVLANFNQLIKENNASIISDPLPVIIADESQMLQLFQNLISNAIKFHDNKAPQIHVSGDVLKNEWRFSVQDNGIGIDSKFFERIFLIFQRIDTNNKYPGRGIGLAICKKIVQRHEGRIWVESIEGKGSTFYISIPRKEFNN